MRDKLAKIARGIALAVGGRVDIPEFDSTAPDRFPNCCAYRIVSGFGDYSLLPLLTRREARKWWNRYAFERGGSVLLATTTDMQRFQARQLRLAGWKKLHSFTSLTTGSEITEWAFYAKWKRRDYHEWQYQQAVRGQATLAERIPPRQLTFLSQTPNGGQPE